MRQVLVDGQAARTSNSSGGISGAACSGGAPWVRRTPSHTATTRALRVGSGRSRSWCANLMADSLRLIVPTFAPRSASAVRYPVTVGGAAGNGSRPPCSEHQAVNSRQSDW